MKWRDEITLRGMSGVGGWNKRQFDLVGIGWPPWKGWREWLVGREYSEEVVEGFVRLKGMRKGKKRVRKKREYKMEGFEESMREADRMYEEDRGVMDAIPVFEDVPSFMRSELDEASELDMGGGEVVDGL